MSRRSAVTWLQCTEPEEYDSVDGSDSENDVEKLNSNSPITRGRTVSPEEYDHMIRKITVGNAQVYSLPRDSLYGACVVLPQVARQLDWHVVYIGLVVKSYVCIAIVYAMQSMFVLEVCKLVWKDDDECSADPDSCKRLGFRPVHEWMLRPDGKIRWYLCFPQVDGDSDYQILRRLCVVAFVLWLFKDVRQTYEIAMLIVKLPTKAGKWMVMKMVSESSMVKLDKKGFLEHEDEAQVEWQIDSMEMKWKIMTAFFIIVPKFLVAVALCYYGSVWLLNTTDRSELILNAVALVFVLELDEAVFAAVMSSDTQTKMDNLQSWAPEPEDGPPASYYSIFQHKCSWMLITLSTFSFPICLGVVCYVILNWYDSHCLEPAVTT